MFLQVNTLCLTGTRLHYEGTQTGTSINCRAPHTVGYKFIVGLCSLACNMVQFRLTLYIDGFSSS